MQEEGNSQTTLYQYEQKPKNSKRVKNRVRRGGVRELEHKRKKFHCFTLISIDLSHKCNGCNTSSSSVMGPSTPVDSYRCTHSHLCLCC